MGLGSAVKRNRLAGLRALRDVLAAEIESTDSARDKAALGRLLVEVLAQIEALKTGAAVTNEDRVMDELEKRRAARAADTVGTGGAGGEQPG